MYISYNKYRVFGKTAMVALCLLFFGVIVLFFARLPEFHFSFQMAVVIILAPLIFCLFVIMTLQLLFFPKAVDINNVDQTLTVHYFFLHPNIIYATDMSAYSTTKLNTRSTNYEGILLHVKSGRKYLFDDMSLSDYKPVKSFLEDYKINFAGHEKFNNFSYFVSFFKYK
jgi:hypothetical protein